MRTVFKASIGLLAASAAAGQSWVHKAAGPQELREVAALSRECPALAVEAVPGMTSKGDVVRAKDAYWRTVIFTGMSDIAGGRGDGCKAASGSVA